MAIDLVRASRVIRDRVVIHTVRYSHDRRFRPLIDDQPKDVGPGIMAHDVEVKLGARNLIEVEVGDQNCSARRNQGRPAPGRADR